MKLYSRKTQLFSLLTLALVLTMVAALAVGCGKKTEKEKADGTKEAEAELTWPTQYQNNRRTGRSSDNGPDTANVKWIYEAGAQTMFWAVLGKDGNVISGFEGKVVSVNPADGTLAWEFSTGTSAARTCRVAEDNTIYVSAGNIVHALSPKGTEKWSYDIGSEADEPSLGSDGTVYVGSAGGELVALTKEGKLKWDFQVPGNIHSPSMDKSGNLYCGASPLVMYALDKNGKKKWELKPEGDLPVYEELASWSNCIAIPSIGDDGTIYAGTFFAPGITSTGQQIPDYAIPQQGKLYAISPKGEKKWEYSHPESKWTIKTPSIGRDGTLYAGTNCFRVIALNPDGTVLWEFNTGEGQNVCPSVFSPSIGKDGLLYAATTSAKIFCITPEGTEKWRFGAEESWLPGMGGSNNFTPPPIGDDGTLFSSLSQGRIYAFEPPATK